MSEESPEQFQTIRLQGRLDASNSPALEMEILRNIEGGTRRLLLDFSDLQFIASAGVHVALAAAKRMKAVNGQLVLCSLSGAVADVFQVSGCGTVLDICEDEEAAAAHLMAR